MADNLTLMTNKIFLNAALPLVKVIATDVPSLAKKFKNIHAVIQVSALDSSEPHGKAATHFVVNAGESFTPTGLHKGNVELQFKSREDERLLQGQDFPATLPKMMESQRPKAFIAFMSVLLEMSNLPGLSAPEDYEEKSCSKVLLLPSVSGQLRVVTSCPFMGAQEP